MKKASAPATRVLPPDSIQIRGARVHNLKNVSLDLPHNRLTVVTGVSGSGKSSLVFDTVYAEGQRRYVESLSSYARQFLDRVEKPAVDEISGLAPPVAIRQKNTTRNPRSTVATSTEIYDYLRLLYARIGRSFCPTCGARVERDTVDQVAHQMLAQPEGSRWYALFPVVTAGGTAALRDHLFDLRKKGFNRLFQQGRTFEFSTPESLLDIDFEKPLFALVDRLAIGPDLHQRIVDTVEICYREGGEIVFSQAASDAPFELRFSERFACKRCGAELAVPEASLFSFNNPMGACPRCQGFGNTIDYDMDLAIPDKSKSIEEGAVDPWTKPQYRHFYTGRFQKAAAKTKLRQHVPFSALTAEEKNFIHEQIQRFFAEVETKKYKVHVRVFLSRYRGYAECPDCHGARLRKEALNVRVGDKNIAELVRLNIAAARDFIHALQLSPEEEAIGSKILLEVRQRLEFLHNVGLDYLTLDRLASTLSGGEAQRIQLATCLGSRLVGACYVLDEPSIGLHSRDTGRLIRILEDLRDLGNTILVVEHDADVMRAADRLVDLGPGAGELGGRVIFEGTYSQALAPGSGSLTARYLSGELSAARIQPRRPVDPKRVVRFLGACANNLKNIDVAIPLRRMVAITGVSGSGKSTLIHEVVYKALQRHIHRGLLLASGEFNPPERVYWKGVENAGLVREVVLVDQTPIGRTPRSNPATYIKAFDLIRDLFASTPEASRRGYTSGHFSFNIPGGRCEVCQGDGTVTVEMQFLADVELVCEECNGARYKPSVLDIRYRGLNIHEVLQLTVKEALAFFTGVPRLLAKLQVLDDTGLSYLRLGQSATTLSGGEAQRVKLADHLGQSSGEGLLFIFDEPTTGRHIEDIAKLLSSFERLIHNGASILIIEHNLDVIRSADWVIDLGPDGGDAGGHIVAEGTPEEIALVPASFTGQYLARHI